MSLGWLGKYGRDTDSHLPDIKMHTLLTQVYLSVCHSLKEMAHGHPHPPKKGESCIILENSKMPRKRERQGEWLFWIEVMAP